MSVSPGWGKGNMVNIRSKERLLLCMSVELCRLTFVVRGCCIGRKSSIYLWSALEWKHIRADPKRESKKEHRGKMEAKIFSWQGGRNPTKPSPRISCNLADISRLLQPTENACRDVCFPSASCAIKIYWRSFLLSRYIQTNQAYFTRLKAHNRDDYVSIYRLHGGSSVWLLNFVFSLLIYFIISLQHCICVTNLFYAILLFMWGPYFVRPPQKFVKHPEESCKVLFLKM